MIWTNAQNEAGTIESIIRWIKEKTVQQVFNLLLCVVAACLMANSLPATAAQTIVSLTFDDGYNQSQVADMLLSHGMKGTFYVNSNLIDSGGGYLSKAELDTLYNNGNEIGGHTINHVDLATLSDAQQQAAICDDMQTLNNWYSGQIHSFAYPFASTGPTTQTILAAGCPGVGTYTSARSVGGLVSGTQCSGCPTAESIPPGNPYYISTPESILSTTTLDQLETLVTQAENNGGGWVPLVFHQVCDGCDLYSISQTTLDAFLTWLQPRQANNTYVRTVNQVMTGDLPPPPPPPQLGPNLLINPSLELDQDANGVPDCWQTDSYGTNNGTWTRITDAHQGAFGEQIQVTSYSSGDLKLLQALDVGQAAGGCAPNVENGASYQLSAWYKSTTPVIPVVFYLDSSGVWQYWRDGPLLPLSSSWAQMSFDVGPVPTGAQAISFGIAIEAVGTLTTDDYSIQKLLVSSNDTTAPAVSLTAPVTGTVSGTVIVSANATDNVGVAGVQFKLDGANLGSEVTTPPYSISWNTLTATNGTHILTAVARDAAGNAATSTGVTVSVNNTDTTAPIVSLTAPAAGTVSGTVAVSANATDNVGVAGVQFKLDGSNLGGEVRTPPYSISWNTLTIANGSHNLTAVARDAAGNTTTSTAVTVTVSNSISQNLISNPSLEIDANNDSIPDCWLPGGYGNNTFVWSRVTIAHSGSFAESLQITSLSSGDRKLLQTLDSGACAPAVTPGSRYALSAWYKSTVPTGFVIYYRDSSGSWVYWDTSPDFAAATNWSQAVYTTQVIPAGATNLSFGLYLSGVGTLVTDDYAMTLAP